MGAYDGPGRALENIRAALESGLEAQLDAVIADGATEVVDPLHYKAVRAGVAWPQAGTAIPSVWVAVDSVTDSAAAFWGSAGEVYLVVAVLYAGADESDCADRGHVYHTAVRRAVEVAVGSNPNALVPGAYSIVPSMAPVLTALPQPEGNRFVGFSQTRVQLGMLLDRAEAP